LLRDVPRTATIRARTSSRLWVVDRAPFLAALGASDDAVQTAAGVIDEHLARPPTSGPGDAEPAES
jgi:CRP-like cAMP-binding protein